MRRLFSLVALAAAIACAQTSVDSIWSAGYVVTMDGSRRVIENGAVAVLADHIVAVGARREIDSKYTAKQRVDKPNAILMPGFIDTHTHAPMVLFRGIADDMRLQDWLQNFIFPAEARNVNAEFVRWGTRMACLEMMLAGTTTYTDMYYFEDAIAEETKAAGMRGVLGQTVIGFPAPDYKTPAAALEGAEKFIARFKNDPLIVPAVAPHAIYTVPDDVLKASRTLANKHGVPILIHLSETRKENDDEMQKRHASPTQILDKLGFFSGGRTLGAHGVWLDDADIATLKARNVGLAHCPSSNMKLASGTARVVDILAAGINMGLGTDGFAGSNNDAILMEEMDLAAKQQKVTRLDPTALTALQAVEMATITGAKALGLDKEIGSLEAGKRADMITISLDEPRATPMYNVYSQLVYALKGSDVRDVMVNGRVIVKDRRVLSLNQALVVAKAKEYQKRIIASLAEKK
jgi:5-methylthioadenosine/S-adenosylhomocysteine deaminase